MIERFADPEGMSSLLDEIQMSGERDMEMIQRAAEAEATSGALDTSKLGLEVGGDTAATVFDLDQGRMHHFNDGDPTVYVTGRGRYTQTRDPTGKAAYPIRGARAGAHRESQIPMNIHRELSDMYNRRAGY